MQLQFAPVSDNVWSCTPSLQLTVTCELSLRSRIGQTLKPSTFDFTWPLACFDRPLFLEDAPFGVVSVCVDEVLLDNFDLLSVWDETVFVLTFEMT